METSVNQANAMSDLIKKRWSPRAFSDQEIAPAVLKSLFEAASWAASSYNEQPWRYIPTRKGEAAHQKLFSTLASGNQSWAGAAPILVLTLAKSDFSKAERPNRHAWYDLGASVAHFALQAATHDLYLHQMAGFDAAKARELFEIPDNFEPATVFALGYHGNAADLPEGVSEPGRDGRNRKSLEETVFDGDMITPYTF